MKLTILGGFIKEKHTMSDVSHSPDLGTTTSNPDRPKQKPKLLGAFSYSINSRIRLFSHA